MNSDTDALLRAAQRERRRIVVILTVLLTLVTGTLATGWMASAVGRDAWHEQAMTWQDRYIELYDEFTATTGEEPSAPDPEVVANQGPQGEPGQQGAPGPVGPTGPSGRDGKDGLPGVAGEPGVPGVQGDTGQAGEDGQDGVPGAAGATGPAGPQGPAGVDGRGIQSLMCDDTTGRWTVTYTDATTADAGSCRTPIFEGELP